MMFLLILISLLPVFFLAVYIYNKDTVKESGSLLIGLFGSGILAILISTIIDFIVMVLFPKYYLGSNYDDFNFITLFLVLFLEVSLVEEGSKWLMLKVFGYRSKEFDQIFDIIVYSVFIALGFAAVENIFYVLQGGFVLGVYRAIFSVPGHAFFGVFMGYYLGLARIYYKKNKFLYVKNLVYSGLIPMLLHTVFNFCLISSSSIYFIISFFVFVAILYVIAMKRINEFSNIKEPLN